MKTIHLSRFYGVADDRYAANGGEFSISKHFDTLTFPRRLKPLRGMTTHTANTGIGNIIIAANGTMYGAGIDLANTPNGKLWNLGAYGGSDDYVALSTNQLSGAAIDYNFLVDWPDAGNVRTVHWASANKLIASDPAGASSASIYSSLTFSSIGQGFVHPKDKLLYFPYRTSSASYVAVISPNATPFSGINTTAFTLPSQYRCYCLTNYGDYLAIPATTPSGTTVNSSIVYLSDRNATVSTFSESIQWGTGSLQVLNNLGGVLIGVSTSSANYAGTFQDQDSILIKAYNGGVEPTLIKEIKAEHLAGSSNPTCTINPRVNFVYRNRLYFSINVNPGDSVQPAWYGLWSVGRNKVTGGWDVTLERVATNDNSETGVLAAAMTGDFVSMVHTAAGTLTRSNNGQTSSSTYAATSIWESAVNPEMPEEDKIFTKQLCAIGVRFQPLPTSGQIVLKYRVDSTGLTSDWVTVQTYTTTGGTFFEIGQAAAAQFTKGRNFEFRLESTGGAVIEGMSYKYNADASILTP